MSCVYGWNTWAEGSSRMSASRKLQIWCLFFFNDFMVSLALSNVWTAVGGACFCWDSSWDIALLQQDTSRHINITFTKGHVHRLSLWGMHFEVLSLLQTSLQVRIARIVRIVRCARAKGTVLFLDWLESIDSADVLGRCQEAAIWSICSDQQRATSPESWKVWIGQICGA